jgi:hypothetical protein
MSIPKLLRRAAGPSLALSGALLWLSPAPAHADEAAKPPFAKKEAPAAPKPASRGWSVKQKSGSKTFVFQFDMKPGVPDPNQVVEVIVSITEETDRPHPRYGKNVPQENAKISFELSNPAGDVVGRYVGHAMPLSSGKYGTHLTPQQSGLYGLAVRGKTKAGDELSAELKLPVDVWPLPKELEGTGDGAAAGRRRPIGVE